MFDESDPVVQFKLDFLRRAMPARDAVVYGDMYRVDAAYTAKCLEYGCGRALLVDVIETPRLLQRRLENPTFDFAKGDFSDALFMATIRRKYEIGVAFDVLLHQAPLLHTLHLMLSKVESRLVVVQPMLEEQATPNSLVYLPGNPDASLHPIPEEGAGYTIFDAARVNHAWWLWGITPSFLRSALVGEGFDVTYEETLAPWPNERWSWWGCLAERHERPTYHWSGHHTLPELYEPPPHKSSEPITTPSTSPPRESQ